MKTSLTQVLICTFFVSLFHFSCTKESVLSPVGSSDDQPVDTVSQVALDTAFLGEYTRLIAVSYFSGTGYKWVNANVRTTNGAAYLDFNSSSSILTVIKPDSAIVQSIQMSNPYDPYAPIYTYRLRCKFSPHHVHIEAYYNANLSFDITLNIVSVPPSTQATAADYIGEYEAKLWYPQFMPFTMKIEYDPSARQQDTLLIHNLYPNAATIKGYVQNDTLYTLKTKLPGRQSVYNYYEPVKMRLTAGNTSLSYSGILSGPDYPAWWSGIGRSVTAEKK